MIKNKPIKHKTRDYLKSGDNIYLQTNKRIHGSENGSRGNQSNSTKTANFAQDSQTMTLAREASKMNKFAIKDSIHSKIASSNDNKDNRQLRRIGTN